MPANGSPTVRRRQLGQDLARYREQAGLSREAVAEKLSYSVATISRIETGRTGVRAPMVRALLDLYNVNDPQVRAALEGLAREGGQRGWWSAYASVINPNYSTYIGFEDGATQIHDYAGIAIPGLLQTADYARAVILAGGPMLDDTEIDKRVDVRVTRQQRLGAGLKLWAIMDEAVIRRLVGGREVMRQQLEHLIEASKLKDVTLQIVPLDAGVYPGMAAMFTIMKFEDPVAAPDVVVAELPTGSLFIEADDAAWYTDAFDRLRALGLSPQSSVAMIEDAVKSLR